MFGVTLKKSVSESRLRFAIEVDLISVGILSVVVKIILVTKGSSFGCQVDVIVGLFFLEG